MNVGEGKRHMEEKRSSASVHGHVDRTQVLGNEGTLSTKKSRTWCRDGSIRESRQVVQVSLPLVRLVVSINLT